MAVKRRTGRIGSIRYIIDPPPKGYVYPCTIDDIRAKLAEIPSKTLRNISVIHLCNQAKMNPGVDAHICDGDTAVLEFREPRKGDIVAALIDGETTLKRFVVKNGKPFLKAENESYPDLIPAQELVVQGVLVAIVRRAA